MTESTPQPAAVAAAAAAPLFPFAAIVGQPQLKTALLLCAIDPTLGGVLIRGDKGSAKSTAARALTALMPPLQRTLGCAYNCDPAAPFALCDACNAADRTVQDAAVPFVTLPLGATEDRVLGTLDLQKVLQGAARSFQPGLLASAHRGILYIDEVNLLADHLVDVLLDAAAMGVNTVQRDGLSVSHPARFTLIGTMNQEEGELRPQLLDRFGLMVDVAAPRDKVARADVVRRRIAFEADPAAFAVTWDAQQAALQTQLQRARQMHAAVVLSDAMLDLISHICCEFDVASLRADIVMHKAARALAALDGRARVTPADVRTAAELVLPHRRRRTPFEQPGLDDERLDELMQQAEQESRQQDQADQAQQHPSNQGRGDDEQNEADDAGDGTDGNDGSAAQADANAGKQQDDEAGNEAPSQFFAGAPASPVRVIQIGDSAADSAAGRRSVAASTHRGQAIRSVPDAAPTSLAVGATLRSAVMRDAGDFKVTRADLHQQVRVAGNASLIVFVVDASGSMAAQSRMEAVKGAVLALLTDAYQRRDEVAVIAFGGAQAQLLLAPTRSIDLAQQGLRDLPTGGRTPLPHALQLVLQLLARRAKGSAPPLLVLLGDGKANVALEQGSAGDADPWRQTLVLAQQLAAAGVAALVLDTEQGMLRLGRAAHLAQALGAPCLTLEQLTADNLALTIQSRLR